MKAHRETIETWVLQVLPDRDHKNPRYIHYNDPESGMSMFIYSVEDTVHDAVQFMSYDSAWRYMCERLINFGHVIKPVKLITKYVVPV